MSWSFSVFLGPRGDCLYEILSLTYTAKRGKVLLSNGFVLLVKMSVITSERVRPADSSAMLKGISDRITERQKENLILGYFSKIVI